MINTEGDRALVLIGRILARYPSPDPSPAPRRSVGSRAGAVSHRARLQPPPRQTARADFPNAPFLPGFASRVMQPIALGALSDAADVLRRCPAKSPSASYSHAQPRDDDSHALHRAVPCVRQL